MDWEQYKVAIPEGQSGPWRVEKFEVPETMDVARIRYTMQGRPVPPGTYTKLYKKGSLDLMMTDTRQEILDCSKILCQGVGRILINGLGLGMIVSGLLRRESVTHIDVVEIDEDIISLVLPHITDERLVVYHEDAFTIQWPKGTRWNYVWHDIWPSICSDNLPDIRKLKQRYGHRTDMQGVWAEYECRRQWRQGY